MQTDIRSPEFRRRALRYVLIAACVIVAGYLASRIPRTMTVFALAAFIAFGAYPLVARISRYMPRGLAIAIVLGTLVGGTVVLALLVVPALVAQVQIFANNTPQYLTVVQSWITQSQDALSARFGPNFRPAGGFRVEDYLTARVSAFANLMVSSLSSILVGAFTAAFIAISALVLSAFFLIRGDSIATSLYDQLPPGMRGRARLLGVELARVFAGFVVGQLALCLVVGALVSIFCSIIHFKFALLIGIVAGIAYAVPFLGAVAVQVIATLISAPFGLQMVIWVNVIIFVISRLADALLVPKIMSESVGVSPIVVMFATFAGGELFGLAGLLLGIPAAALIKVAWQFFRSPDGGLNAVEAVEAELSTPLPVPSAPEPTPQEA